MQTTPRRDGQCADMVKLLSDGAALDHPRSPIGGKRRR